jgi:hypothetical protein
MTFADAAKPPMMLGVLCPENEKRNRVVPRIVSKERDYPITPRSQETVPLS